MFGHGPKIGQRLRSSVGSQDNSIINSQEKHVQPQISPMPFDVLPWLLSYAAYEKQLAFVQCIW